MSAVDRSALPIVVFDLDSTLADTRNRRQFLPVDAMCPADWFGYHINCLTDVPVQGVVQLVQLLYPHYRIVIVTARPALSEIHEKTHEWLDLHQVPRDTVVLMPLDESRTTGAWKADVVAKLRTNGVDVVLAVDDWGPNGWAIEETGTPFLHVARPGTDVPTERPAIHGTRSTT